MQGLVDIGKEITKLEGKKDKLISSRKRLEESMAKPDYKTKVPENVQTQNNEKVRT